MLIKIELELTEGTFPFHLLYVSAQSFPPNLALSFVCRFPGRNRRQKMLSIAGHDARMRTTSEILFLFLLESQQRAFLSSLSPAEPWKYTTFARKKKRRVS